jgi:hypothetical protein
MQWAMHELKVAGARGKKSFLSAAGFSLAVRMLREIFIQIYLCEILF